MSEDIKSLIDKINKEGVERAEQNAAQIEAAAKEKSEEIIARAQSQAERLISEAKDKIFLMAEKQKILLLQAGRDLLLNLKQEINAMLDRLITSEVKSALHHDNLGKMIMDLVKHYASQIKGDVVISAKKEDIDNLGQGFLAKLKEETKKGITLKPSQEIQGGFTISFDSGRSCFDFTDKALAEYIGTYLKPKLKQILDEAVK